MIWEKKGEVQKAVAENLDIFAVWKAGDLLVLAKRLLGRAPPG